MAIAQRAFLHNLSYENALNCILNDISFHTYKCLFKLLIFTGIVVQLNEKNFNNRNKFKRFICADEPILTECVS